MDINWDYTNREIHLSMLSYVQDALTRFRHARPRKPQDQPYSHVNPTYGVNAQYATDADPSPLLKHVQKKFVQEVTGTFLYYNPAIDSTMLPALGTIATQQSALAEKTMHKVHQFIDYAATHPDAIITYRASNMILAAHSDASYLSESKARIRAGGLFFMSNDSAVPPNNGSVLTISKITNEVMSSAAEAELGSLFINCREAIPERHALETMGH